VKVGDAVHVAPDPATWHKGAVESLTGMAGHVEEIRPDGQILVRLTKRPRPWHTSQVPSDGWWFVAGELTVIPEKPWRVTKLVDRGKTEHYRFRVEGENLNHPPGSPGRRFSWAVPDVDDPSFDLSHVQNGGDHG